MIVLGIESSCDETACAVVEDGRKIRSSVVFSQEKIHRPFRGIVPEIASRAHVEEINGVIHKAMLNAGCRTPDAIAVTVGPGLVGSLLVGKMTAEALGWIWNKPVAPVNHLEGHLFANLLEDKNLAPPFLGLIVSGGHTDLVIVENFGQYKILGRTRDDAAGEAFDKVANILNLGYPGGALIDRYAKTGDRDAIPFSRPYLHGTWDFSFSGLKTAVLYHVRDRGAQDLHDICASFQSAVVDVLIRKTIKAAKKMKLKSIVVGGGVSANSELRKRFLNEGKENGLRIYLPTKQMCTDNAAMIAAAGYYKLKTLDPGCRMPDKNNLNVDPALPIQNWS